MIGPRAAITTFGLGLLVTHGFGLSLVPALLPEIADSLDAGYAQLGLAVASGIAFYSIGALSAGGVLERVPNKALVVATFVMPAVGLLVGARASSGLEIGLAVIILGVNAGLSWPATIHVITETVPAVNRTMVMSACGAGVGLGLIVNGALVQLAGGDLGWRPAMVAAAAITLLPIVAGLVVIPSAIDRPQRPAGGPAGFGEAARSTAGRVVALAGLAGGLFGFPFVAFLSAVAVDELGASAGEAALLWWLVGGAGMVWSVVFGRLGERTSPMLALIVGTAAFVATFIYLSLSWTYLALAVTAALFVTYYYPMWGLAGAIASAWFPASVAVRAVALGLIGAAVGGSVGSSVAGAWFDATGTLRGVVLGITGGMALVLVYFVIAYRSLGQARAGAPR